MTAAMALRALARHASWRMATRALKEPPDDVVADTATGSRTAVSSARQIVTSARIALSWVVSVQPICSPEIVDVWNSASLRWVIAVRWKTGLRFITP